MTEEVFLMNQFVQAAASGDVSHAYKNARDISKLTHVPLSEVLDTLEFTFEDEKIVKMIDFLRNVLIKNKYELDYQKKGNKDEYDN